MKLIHILGSGHCGSTLLAVMLGNHSSCFNVGELHRLPLSEAVTKRFKCTCGEAVQTCAFWQKTISCAGGSFQKGVDNLQVRKNEKLDLKVYQAWHKKLFECIESSTGKSIIIDSSKDPKRARILADDAFVVHIVRDGRGVVGSFKRKGCGVVRSTLQWLVKNICISFLRTRMKVIKIRYSDLVRDPTNELKRICDESGISYEDGMLSLDASGQHQFAGNRLRLHKGQSLEEDLSWKKELTIFDRICFFAFGGWLNIFYG